MNPSIAIGKRAGCHDQPNEPFRAHRPPESMGSERPAARPGPATTFRRLSIARPEITTAQKRVRERAACGPMQARISVATTLGRPAMARSAVTPGRSIAPGRPLRSASRAGRVAAGRAPTGLASCAPSPLAAGRRTGPAESAFALGVQVGQVRPREDHPVEDWLELGVSLVADRLDLALVAIARGLLLEEGAQGRDVALAEYLSQKPDVLLVASRHRRPRPARTAPGTVRLASRAPP